MGWGEWEGGLSFFGKENIMPIFRVAYGFDIVGKKGLSGTLYFFLFACAFDPIIQTLYFKLALLFS